MAEPWRLCKRCEGRLRHTGRNEAEHSEMLPARVVATSQADLSLGCMQAGQLLVRGLRSADMHLHEAGASFQFCWQLGLALGWLCAGYSRLSTPFSLGL